MPDDSMKKTIMVALTVCIACSVLVSATAVSLQGIQEENRQLDRIRNILQAADLLGKGGDISSVYKQRIEPSLIDLSSGNAVPEKKYNEIL